MRTGGGAGAAINRAAGQQLLGALFDIPEVKPGIPCPTGEARITPGFKLPASCVIHTVGPIHFIDKNPAASLRNAYRNSLMVAKANKIEYIAFPAICCGAYGQVAKWNHLGQGLFCWLLDICWPLDELSHFITLI
ncbi:uncharacterized protein LOC131182395 isoform X1 [Hevea brasiliensis]|uniref:uncharacterized protein LOC131182395 isoform X1 n=1 Tax=Hevea brasiliensis TaxID=3981 RepID=UPI002601294B|nr:uncharacterized protein LOC131182395 isoform X1 [Hevea brasiliensis]